VIRVLLDENLPRKLGRELHDCYVRTVQEEGWTSYSNGELLSRARGSFDVFLTADRRLQFQQNLTRFDIGVVVIVTPRLRFRTIRWAVDAIRTAIQKVKPGEVIHVRVGAVT
jgi:hypothetical protein